MTLYGDEAAHRAEQDQIDSHARDLGTDILQPLDGLETYVCGFQGCGTRATQIMRRHVGTPNECGMLACDDHVTVMVSAARRSKS